MCISSQKSVVQILPTIYRQAQANTHIHSHNSIHTSLSLIRFDYKKKILYYANKDKIIIV